MATVHPLAQESPAKDSEAKKKGVASLMVEPVATQVSARDVQRY